MRLDTATLCASLLHDTVEDTSASLQEVQTEFGDEIASLVDGDAQPGAVEDADVVVRGAPSGFFHLVINHRLDEVEVEGDRDVLEQLLRAPAAPEPVTA
jgi:hypothetical protein